MFKQGRKRPLDMPKGMIQKFTPERKSKIFGKSPKRSNYEEKLPQENYQLVNYQEKLSQEIIS